MLAVIIHNPDIIYSSNSSLYVCNIEYSISNIVASIDKFNRFWNSGLKKFKVTEIFMELGRTQRDKTDIKLNKETVFTKKHEMISKLFEFGEE